MLHSSDGPWEPESLSQIYSRPSRLSGSIYVLSLSWIRQRDRTRDAVCVLRVCVATTNPSYTSRSAHDVRKYRSRATHEPVLSYVLGNIPRVFAVNALNALTAIRDARYLFARVCWRRLPASRVPACVEARYSALRGPSLTHQRSPSHATFTSIDYTLSYW